MIIAIVTVKPTVTTDINYGATVTRRSTIIGIDTDIASRVGRLRSPVMLRRASTRPLHPHLLLMDITTTGSSSPGFPATVKSPATGLLRLQLHQLAGPVSMAEPVTPRTSTIMDINSPEQLMGILTTVAPIKLAVSRMDPRLSIIILSGHAPIFGAPVSSPLSALEVVSIRVRREEAR